MIEIGVKSSIDKLIASLSAWNPGQFEYSVARALTATAKDSQEAVRRAMPSEFILRRYWIVKGIRIVPARKDDLRAFVYSKDPFMGRQEYGGEKRPKIGGRYVAIPMKGGARETDRDLIPKEYLPANMPMATYRTSRRTGLPHASNKGVTGAAFILRANDGEIYLCKRIGRTLKFLYVLRDESEVKPRLNMEGITLRTTRARFVRHLMLSIREAMATRKEGGTLTE